MKHQRERWITGGFIIASGLILFFNLWGRSLENHGYIRYAEIAREMIRSGEWIVPRLNGEIFIDKPPLLFWLIAIPSSIYGSVTPFIAKLPSALSAWIGVIILFRLGKGIYGTNQAGLISGGILLSSYQYFFQSRLAKTDIILCLWIILSLYFFYLAFYSEDKMWRYLFFCFSFFFMALGVLTKGPFGLFPLLIIYIFLIKERKWKIVFCKEFIICYLILGVIVLTWVTLFIYRVGWIQTMTIIKESKILTRTGPFYFYFIQIWGQFFPWSIFLPFFSIYLWKERKNIWQSKHSYFLIWFFLLFILLSLFKYRASRYLLPALPPLALMIGGMWKKRLKVFIIIFILTISIWHIREFIWIKNNLHYSPGMVLVKELKPYLKDEIPLAYRLDLSTLEEINFYLDPPSPIPILKDIHQIKIEKGRLILMPEEYYNDFKTYKNFSIIFLKEFQYKKGKLVLISCGQ